MFGNGAAIGSALTFILQGKDLQQIQKDRLPAKLEACEGDPTCAMNRIATAIG